MHQEKITEGTSAYIHEVQHFLDTLYDKFKGLREDQGDDNEAFLGILEQAHKEWKGAESFFQSVSDPDLIDHAIYRMEAAKSRYVYLLKQAKKDRIKASKIE